ncbi:SusC/RagA family TonB-linked outer membrane protein [Gangjinia marincola]|uniref:SusC/RagA family TonB-linked outer membrane protein n=1 Tax=Gangjinia marincola TaxID=578463 RepID=A0ABN1MJY2_9FLAO
MRTKFSGMLTLLLAFVVQLTFAQEKTVSGTVTDDSGLPLPGVNVVVKGTNKGTQTDFDGLYSINASQGETLIFSYQGFKAKEAKVGAGNTINIQMETDVAQLEEVVITAQNIQREKRSLGYAVSQVKAEEIQEQPQGDIGRILQGKAAGVNITATNGVSGSGTNFIIRGYSSISGSNQPLFIVDGVPFDGGANEQTAFFDNVSESSRFLDLDPNLIEDVQILKGLSATVLYGERGRNGVVLITTKNGSTTGGSNKKMEVTATTSYFINEAVLPDYQTEYGGGFHQAFGFFFSNWGPSFNNTNENIYGSSFRGISPSGTVLVEHPFNRINDATLVEGFEDLAASDYEYRNYDNVDEFFRTGGVSTTSINLRGNTEKVNYNINYGYLDDKGFTPGNSLRRNTFGIGGSAILANNLSANASLNYVTTDYKTPPISASAGSGTIGDGGSVFGDVLYTPRSVDLMGLPFQAADGRSIYYRSGNDIQNPRWTVRNAKVTQGTERIYGRYSLNYNFSEDFNVNYLLGIDNYTEFNTYGQNKGGVDGEFLGIFRTISARNTIWNHTLNFSYNTELSEDWSLNSVIGAQTRRDVFDQDGVESTQQLAFGVLRHFNFVTHSTVNSFTGGEIAFRSEENQIGIYGDVSIGFKNALFFNVSGRNDWSSTLETDNYSIFYPGASLSFVPTTMFEEISSKNGLNYLKARIGFGTSAGFPIPYGTRNQLALTSRDFVDLAGNVISSNSVANRLGNPDLEPERISEIEAGIDTRFFDNRFGLNVSVFRKNSEDLITDQNLDPSTGFTVVRINAGELETEGIEIDFDVTPIRTDNFNWNISGNFYADENTITRLPEGTDQIVLTSSIGGRPANYAVEGEPFGVLLGSTIQRDENGNKVVGDNGLYLVDPELSIIGDPNPDWTSGITNTFSYKGFNFSFNWLYRHGGDIFSQTASTLVGRGVVDFDDPIDRTQTYILPGVNSDGSVNTNQITATNVGFGEFGFGANENQIFDGTTIRLNEVSLGYNIPQKFLEKTPFGTFNITFLGNNLWYRAVNFPKDVNFDTNTLSTGVGNGQGIDYITGPSSRRYGFSVRATF